MGDVTFFLLQFSVLFLLHPLNIHPSFVLLLITFYGELVYSAFCFCHLTFLSSSHIYMYFWGLKIVFSYYNFCLFVFVTAHLFFVTKIVFSLNLFIFVPSHLFFTKTKFLGLLFFSYLFQHICFCPLASVCPRQMEGHLVHCCL